MIDKTEQLLSSLVDKLIEKSSASGLTPTQLEEVLQRVGVNSAEAMRSSLKPENPDHPHISAFFTEDDRTKYGSWENKPKLRRKTFFNGTEEDAERLTCAEVEAYNALTDTVEARNGKWKAEVKHKGTDHEVLSVSVPCATVDQRMDMPASLFLLLHELGGGPNTSDIGALVNQIDDLKRQLEVAKGLGTVKDLQSLLG